MNAITLGLIAALCWALHDISIRYLSRSVALLEALLLVLIVGTLFQGGLFAVFGNLAGFSAQAFLLSVLAGIGFLIASLGLYYAFERGPVRLVSPLIASYPVLSLAFATATGANISTGQVLAVLGIVMGVGLVAGLSDQSAEQAPPIGKTILLSLISAFGFASTFKLGQMATTAASDEFSTTLITRLVCLALLVSLMLYKKRLQLPIRSAWLPLILMGLLDGIALLAVLSAGSLPQATFASVASSIFGLLTVLLAALFLKERMSGAQWLASVLTFGCIGYLAL